MFSIKSGVMDVNRIRKHFPAVRYGRTVTNNAASTQIPDRLLNLHRELSAIYENVHRGQSSASVETTSLFENAYKVIANFIGAESWREIILYRGTTEAINSVMYSLMTEFKDGDNVVTTYMEHNSNYVPWYGLTKEILPKFNMNVECRLVKFDKETGELDLDHMASLVDDRTKIVCCTGASNFLGTKPPLDMIRKISNESGYRQPNGMNKSYLLVDGAQLVPNVYMDVVKADIDFLAWSFHKMLAPFGVGALYGKREILESIRPFNYGGDMIAEGQVSPEHVGYNLLPWKFTAGTPNILGTILAGEATKFLVEIVLGKHERGNYGDITEPNLRREDIKRAMTLVENYEQELSGYLIEELSSIKGVTIYGPKDPKRRTSPVSFNIEGKNPFFIAKYLDKRGIESRAGCHCATLAHYFYGLNPPASCRISPYIYNNMAEMESVVKAIKDIST
jgi:cysteine desulfurase/selenocysteine lyase